MTLAGGLGIGGVICVAFGLLSIARGRFESGEDNRGKHYVERDRQPQTFWIVTLGSVALGVILLGVAAFLQFR